MDARNRLRDAGSCGIMKVLLLGGYGAVGYETAKRLLRRTGAEVVIAGRRLGKAESAAARLSEEIGSTRVSGSSVDASNHDELVSAFRTADWAIVCIPLAGLGGGVAQAAYEAGVHYIDINANREKQVYLQTMAARIKERGLIFVTEAGLGPGVPSLLVRYAHEQLGRLETVDVASIFRESTVSRGTAYDMLVALGERHRVFKNGAWRKAPMTATKEIDFGAPYGRQR
jgi:saccharopine dehydrogenase-like NADP-dependent oxidoreductase